jgi:hypothetical protein
MQNHYSLVSLTSGLLTAAKLLPPEEFWRLAAVVTRTLKQEDVSRTSSDDERGGDKTGH